MHIHRITEYSSLPAPEQSYWLEQIGQGQWRAAKYLHDRLLRGDMQEKYGPDAKVFLLTQDKTLIGFCTYTMRDEHPDPSLFPWVGFVYTAPEHRGNRYSQVLIDYVCDLAVRDGHRQVYLTSDHTGLYEKYGFSFLGSCRTESGDATGLYIRRLDCGT